MAEQMRPASKAQAPDPSYNYERSHPEVEAGLGRLDTDTATPHQHPDKMEQAVTHRQEPRQINAHEAGNSAAARIPAAGGSQTERSPAGGGAPPPGSSQPLPGQDPQSSMNQEEPLGWDQAPKEASDPSDKRHPRIEGRGGTP